MNVRLTVQLLFLSLMIAACTPVNQRTDLVKDEPISIMVGDRSLVTMVVGDDRMKVEAVNSDESITKGLGERDEIGSDGMLFVLPEKRHVYFWMKGMRFDIDMVWIDTGTVIGVTPNVPAPATLTQQLPTYPSPGEVTHVLELPAGDAAKRNITIGDKVTVIPD